MDSNLLNASGFGILAFVIYIVVSIVLFLIGLWIAYAVIWRAVRRGLKEFHKDNPTAPTP
jgi:Sec-independent protein secretion pathway component TatC